MMQFLQHRSFSLGGQGMAQLVGVHMADPSQFGQLVDPACYQVAL